MKYEFETIKKELEGYNFKYLEYYYNSNFNHGIVQWTNPPYLITIEIEPNTFPQITIHDNYKPDDDGSTLNVVGACMMYGASEGESNEEALLSFEMKFLKQFNEDCKPFIRQQKIKNVLNE